MIVHSYNLANATAIGILHRDLNPDHTLTVAICNDCQTPIGLLCRTCRTPLAYIRSECTHAASE